MNEEWNNPARWSEEKKEDLLKEAITEEVMVMATDVGAGMEIKVLQ